MAAFLVGSPLTRKARSSSSWSRARFVARGVSTVECQHIRGATATPVLGAVLRALTCRLSGTQRRRRPPLRNIWEPAPPRPEQPPPEQDRFGTERLNQQTRNRGEQDNAAVAHLHRGVQPNTGILRARAAALSHNSACLTNGALQLRAENAAAMSQKRSWSKPPFDPDFEDMILMKFNL